MSRRPPSWSSFLAAPLALAIALAAVSPAEAARRPERPAAGAQAGKPVVTTRAAARLARAARRQAAREARRARQIPQLALRPAVPLGPRAPRPPVVGPGVTRVKVAVPEPKPQPRRPAPTFDGLVDASERWLNRLPAGRGANAAFERYRRAAKRGDAVAMARMAACLEAGRGCKRNPAAAWRCWIAAAHGSDEAIRQTVARRLLRGDGVRRDRALARRLLAFGGMRGDARAQLALGEDLLDGAPDVAERLAGLRWLARAALKDHPGAAGAWLRHAEALPAEARARAEADLAALGRGQAAGAIARAAAHGPGGALVALAEAGGDAAGAPRLLERAAAHDPQAMVGLAQHHEGGGDAPRAATWYRRAAARGRVDAMLALGRGRDADAVDWLRQAALAGSPVAMRLLGDRLSQVKLAADLPTARRWYEAAASRGDVQALVALAGIAERPEDAARWWGLAARRQAPGAAEARAKQLATLSPEQQARVTRDMATWALRHPRAGIAVAPPSDLPAGAAGDAAKLRAYAQAGAPWAQTALGHALAVGKHGPADAAEAATWWLRAAHQGDRLAQANLAEAYAAGRGLPRDDAFAFAWWCLATDRDPLAGAAGYPYAGRLSPEQAAQAAKLAADWRRRTSDLPEVPAP